MIDIEKLAKVMCIVDGKHPQDTHNGYDKIWKLYFSKAHDFASLYNELYGNSKMSGAMKAQCAKMDEDLGSDSGEGGFAGYHEAMFKQLMTFI
jgi:hypothetical protein